MCKVFNLTSSDRAPKSYRISVRDYDLAEINKAINGIFTQVAIMSVMHFWLKMTQPLIFQCITPFKSFFMLPVVQIRLFGWKAEGSLARPWKAPSMFG